tara:strand:- start:1629 stop:5507 length:3879 start_codon:yes stop_codon:yes gene_type:complete
MSKLSVLKQIMEDDSVSLTMLYESNREANLEEAPRFPRRPARPTLAKNRTGSKTKTGNTAVPTPQEVKQVAEKGTPAQKSSMITDLMRFRMMGMISDGEAGLGGLLSFFQFAFLNKVLSSPKTAKVLGFAATKGGMAALYLLAAGVGGGVGAYFGKKLNQIGSKDLDGEAKERISAALNNPKAAINELLVYCEGAGKLCRRNGGNTRCAKAVPFKRKDGKTVRRVKKYGPNKNFVGGYVYEGGEGPGIGDGRLMSTDSELEREEYQKKMAASLGHTATAIISSPLAVIQKLARPLTSDAKKGYIQTPGQFHVNDVAMMLALANSLIKHDIESGNITYDASKKEYVVGGGADFARFTGCIKEILRAPVSRAAMAKYKWLESNYALVQAVMKFPTFKELKRIRKTTLNKVPGTVVGPVTGTKKCDSYPMTVGCKGQQPATTLAILLRGTEFGKAQFVANKEQFTKLFNDKIYTPELKDFIEKAIVSIDDTEMKGMNDALQTLGVKEDLVKDPPQKIASDFANNDGTITDKSQFDFLLGKIALANDIKLKEHKKNMTRLRSIINEIIEEEYEIVAEELLTEGGAGGHMRHPFDLDDVKTGEDLIKKFEQMGSEIKGGKQPDTKIDGVNTSIKIIDTPTGKEFAMDRGSGKSIDVEGITTDRLPERFSAGHGMIPAGENVLGIFNDALKEASSELKELGVLDDPTKFFNMEYVKGTTNVLAYDHDFLKIHGINQFYEKKNRKGQPVRPGLERPIDPETNKTIKDPSVPVAYDQEVMDRLVEKLNKVADKYGFKVYSEIPSTSTGDFDFSPVMDVPVPVTYSTGDIREETLGDRLKAAKNRIKEKVRTVDGRTPPAQGKEIYKAVLGASAADTNADPERQIPLDELLASDEDYQRAIDGAVFWHATRLLGNVIMNNMVVDHPAVSGPATEHEGLVIRLSGDDFDTKITGEFILGGEATSFRAGEPEAEKEVKAKNIALFPGSFKPPHKGHLSVIERVAKNPEVDEVKVIISAPGKNVRSAKITPEKAKAIFEKFISAANISKPVSVEVSSKPSPITAAYDYIVDQAGPNENVLLLTSEADSKRYPQESLDKYAGMNKNAETLTVRGFVLPVCRDEGCDTTEKVSATTIRKIVDSYPDITLQDLTKAVDHMPEKMSTADKLATFEMLVDDSLSNKFEDEELNTLNESVRFILETIEKALDIVLLTEKVRKTKGKEEYCVVSKNKKTKEGKLRTYGCYRSRKAANKRLGQVEGFKARAMAEGEEIEEYQIVEMSSMSGGNVQGYAGGNKNKFSLIREED